MKILLFAYHDIGCCALKTLHAMGENIQAVFTHEDDPKENLWFESVKKLAEALKIPTFSPENPNSEEWISKIKSLAPDIIFSFYYRKILSPKILTIPPKGAYNLHGSLLPKFRGRAPVNWAILKGEKETGITLHEMVQKADAGDILAQKKVAIEESDTALTLFKKLIPLTQELLLETVPLIQSGKMKRTPQDHSQATKFGGRKPEDGKIDWKLSSQEIYNLIRAVTHPYPGAFSYFEGKKVTIWWAKKELFPGQPGEILSLNPLICGCGEGALEIAKIQAETDTELDGQEWVNKYKVEIGMKFGD